MWKKIIIFQFCCRYLFDYLLQKTRMVWNVNFELEKKCWVIFFACNLRTLSGIVKILIRHPFNFLDRQSFLSIVMLVQRKIVFFFFIQASSEFSKSGAFSIFFLYFQFPHFKHSQSKETCCKKKKKNFKNPNSIHIANFLKNCRQVALESKLANLTSRFVVWFWYIRL